MFEHVISDSSSNKQQCLLEMSFMGRLGFSWKGLNRSFFIYEREMGDYGRYTREFVQKLLDDPTSRETMDAVNEVLEDKLVCSILEIPQDWVYLPREGANGAQRGTDGQEMALQPQGAA